MTDAEYLSIQEINSMEEDIKHEMTLLLSNKAIVFKPNSLQLQFFSDCLNSPFNSRQSSKFSSLGNTQNAQLKFEVEDKLRKFYLRPGRKINFVFQIIPHRRKYSLIRIPFVQQGENRKILTVYCTSKIERYWKEEGE